MRAEREKGKREQASRLLLVVLALFVFGLPALADVSVVASIDRDHIAFGESVKLTITVQGTQGAAPPSIPKVDDLIFNGPSTHTSFSFGTGPTSQSISFVYQITPSRTGELTIPSIEVNVSGTGYRTEPIKLVVEQGAVQNDLSEGLSARLDCPARQLYPGQVLPLDVYVIARKDVPLRQLSRPQFSTDGLDCRFAQKNWEQGQQVIDGQMFNVFGLHGAITALKLGSQALGPGVVKGGVEIPRRRRNDFDLFDQMFARPDMREVTVTIDQIPIEVLPLPEEGRTDDFSGAIGEWKIEVTAKPTEVAVGDPITLTIKIGGRGNIDTVPAPKLGSLDGFKTYDPTTKTTKDELNTTGQRVIQQVLIAKSTEVKALPEVRLSYFDPVAGAYKVATQPPINLSVKAGSGERSTIVGGRLRPDEKLGQDIVYLKGDFGPGAPAVPFCTTPMFWALNVVPVFALLGGIGWKRRTDRLRGDVAYARRSRAAKNARKLLATATSYDEIQRALQGYLGDRLNIPSGGITASIADEQLVPRGVNGELAARTSACFEACDTARFAGNDAGAGVQSTREKVEQLIDDLENQQL